jgi:hypothetical protein
MSSHHLRKNTRTCCPANGKGLLFDQDALQHCCTFLLTFRRFKDASSWHYPQLPSTSKACRLLVLLPCRTCFAPRLELTMGRSDSPLPHQTTVNLHSTRASTVSLEAPKPEDSPLKYTTKRIRSGSCTLPNDYVQRHESHPRIQRRS